MSDGNTGLRSGRIWHSSAGNSFSFSTTFGAGFLISLLFLCGAVSAQAQDSHPAKQIEAPKPKQVVSPDAAFAEARRLTLQGKFDEAGGELEGTAAKHPNRLAAPARQRKPQKTEEDYVKTD